MSQLTEVHLGGFVGPRWILNTRNYCFVPASYIRELVSFLASRRKRL